MRIFKSAAKKKTVTQKSSIATMPIVSGLVAVFVIVGGFVTLSSIKTSSLLEKNLQHRAEQVTQLQTQALLQPVADYEEEQVQTLIDNLVKDRDIIAARVLDEEGEIFAASGEWSDVASLVIPSNQELLLLEGGSIMKLGFFEMQVSRQSLIKAQQDNLLMGIGETLFITLALYIVLMLCFRQAINPLRTMISVMGALSNNQTEIDIPNQQRTNEIGEIARSLQIFKNNMIQAINASQEQKQTQKEQLLRTQKIEGLNGNFDTGIRSILEIVTGSTMNLQETALRMSSISDETNNQVTGVSTASAEVTRNIGSVADATAGLSQSISEIGEQINHSTQVSTDAAQMATDTQKTVQGLVDAANRIGEVLSLINDIAEQTNLLALNATIEAARAGESGKGFAVVASEVKALAGQTAKATEEIGNQITAVQNETQHAVTAINKIVEMIDGIKDSVTNISTSVTDQDATTAEIAGNINDVSQGTAEVSSTITKVSEIARETGQEATAVLTASKDLAQQSEDMRNMVESFLNDVKAA